jgi:hypothetical protein
MYTIKLLAPVLMGLCADNFMNGQGEYCNSRQSNPPVVKYYEPGKSCYKNGIFYEKCENSPEVRY